MHLKRGIPYIQFVYVRLQPRYFLYRPTKAYLDIKGTSEVHKMNYITIQLMLVLELCNR